MEAGTALEAGRSGLFFFKMKGLIFEMYLPEDSIAMIAERRT